MVNIRKLKGKMVEKGINATELSSVIGIDKTTFYRKISSGGDSFTIKEVDKMSTALGLQLDEAIAIFFNQYVA